MRILVVGGGAREHAIFKALQRSPSEAEMFVVMKNRNPAMARDSVEYGLMTETNVEMVVDWAEKRKIDLAVIGPEAPLGEGLADALIEKGIKSVGPSSSAARIEISKEFMRDLMERHQLPGRIGYRVLDDAKEAESYINSLDYDVVIKPVGLTGGKGVKITGEQLASKEEAIRYAKEVIEQSIGGSSRVVVEEKVEGEEFTLQCFCDGRNVVPMPAVQDHKRAFEGDKGPNTGGMGSYSQEDHLLPFLTEEEYQAGVDIVRKTVEAMADDGSPYKGILYGQFMLTKDGPKVIEFNCRFGDPEAMNVLPLLESDFVNICVCMGAGCLSPADVRFSKKATVCKYVVPEGYGIKSLVGEEVSVDEKAIAESGAELFYASVNEEGGKIFTTSSRSLGVVGISSSIEGAEAISEKALSHVSGRVFMRHDIGKKEAIERKVRHMEDVRNR